MKTSKKPVSNPWVNTPPLLEWGASYYLQAVSRGYPEIVVKGYVLFRTWWPVLIPPILLMSIVANEGGQGSEGGLSVVQWLLCLGWGAILFYVNYSSLNDPIIQFSNDGIHVLDSFLDTSRFEFYSYESITEYQIVDKGWGKSLVIITEMRPRVAVIIHPEVSIEQLELILSTQIKTQQPTSEQ